MAAPLSAVEHSLAPMPAKAPAYQPTSTAAAGCSAEAIIAVASGPSPSSSSTATPSGEQRTTQTETRRGPPPAPPCRMQLAQHALVRLQLAIIGLDEEAAAAGVAHPPRRDRQAAPVDEGPDVDGYALMMAMFHVTASALKHLSIQSRDRSRRMP